MTIGQTKLSENEQKLRYKEYNGEYKEWLLYNYSNSTNCIEDELDWSDEEKEAYLEGMTSLFEEINSIAKKVLTKKQWDVWNLYFIENMSGTQISKKLKKSSAYTINTLNMPIKDASPLLKEDNIYREKEDPSFKLYGGAFKKVLSEIKKDDKIFDKWKELLLRRNL